MKAPPSPRLLMVTTTAVTLEAFLLPFATHFRRLGYRVDAMARGGPEVAAVRDAFDTVHDAPWSRSMLDPQGMLSGTAHVRRIVAGGAYDIVHAHTPVAGFLTRLALPPGCGAARIYTAHGFHFHPAGGRAANTFYRTLERLAGRRTDWLVVINLPDFEAARRHAIVPPERVRHIPGVGIDTSAWSPSGVTEDAVLGFRRELGLRDGDTLFSMVAEFNPDKRHRDAVRALARLGRSDVHLALAGRGRLQEATRRLARRCGLDAQVHLLGQRRDVPVLLRSSRASVLPSEREGLPRSVMESLSLEVPVIGADVRGTRDLVAGGGGILFPLGDLEALSAAMAALLDDPVLASSLGRSGRRSLRSFELETVLKYHEDLYGDALESLRLRRAQALH